MPIRKTNSMNLFGVFVLLFESMLLISTMVFGFGMQQNVFFSRQLLMTTAPRKNQMFIETSSVHQRRKRRRRRLNDSVGGSELYMSSLDDDEGVETSSVTKSQPTKELDAQEKAWRFVKKPLLHIGSKGATRSHGNSLRQLLDDHTVVKVKVNTRKFDGSLENAATALKQLAIENGAPDDIEIIQMRNAGNLVLYGIPGTLQKMDEGTFPPPPPPPKEDETTLTELSP